MRKYFTLEKLLALLKNMDSTNYRIPTKIAETIDLPEDAKQAIIAKAGDLVIVAGDFGVPWYADKTAKYADIDERVLSYFREAEFTVAFIDGNHASHRRCFVVATRSL